MTKEVRGLCLIINLEKFDDPNTDNRAGSSVDAKNLEKLSTELGFEVRSRKTKLFFFPEISFCAFPQTVVHDNLTYNKIITVVDDFAQDFRHRRSDMCIVAIMSHGNEKNLLSADGVLLDIETELLEKFNTANCPDLEGKPKCFIIQACRFVVSIH